MPQNCLLYVMYLRCFSKKKKSTLGIQKAMSIIQIWSLIMFQSYQIMHVGDEEE